MDIHIFLHDESHAAPGVSARSILDLILKKVNSMSDELSALQASVAKNTTVTQSAITLIQGIKTALDAAIASGDPAALTALSASLDADDTALAAAVSANTPAAKV